MSKKASDVLTGANMALGNSAPALATNTLATGAVVVAFNGRVAAIAAGVAAALPVTDAATKKAFIPLNSGEACVFVVGVDKAGTRFAFQGRVGDEVGYGSGSEALEFPPNIPENVCPIVLITVRLGANAADGWTPATGFVGVTGVTSVAQAVAWLPSAPMFVTA